jgi:hypothetical protein
VFNATINNFASYNPAKADTYTEATSMAKDKASLPQHLVKARNTQTLANWQNLQSTVPGACLVHSLRKIHQVCGTVLFNQPAQSVFSQWDLISTSLVNLFDIKPFTEASATGAYTERKNGCIGEIGLILDVPAQNIYGTHSADVYVDNDAGVDHSADANTHKRHKNTDQLADHLKVGINHTKQKIAGEFSRFVTPTQLLNETKNYNEVLVIGRDAININFGEKQTGAVKVKGILSARTKKFTDPDKEQRAQREHMEAIEKLQAANPGLKVFTF